MNSNVIMGILRELVPGIVAYAAGRGWISAGEAGEISAAIITLGSAAWSATTNTQAAAIVAVTDMKDVAKVVPRVNADPDSAVAIAAADKAQPKVGPSATITKSTP